MCEYCLNDFDLSFCNIHVVLGWLQPEDVKCRLQVRDAGHCFTITETTQTFTKMLALGIMKFKGVNNYV